MTPCWTLLRRTLLLCTLLLPSLSAAATYHVSLSGSDANTCSAAQSTSTPKRTLVAGVNCLQAAGDILYLRGGNYGSERLDDTQATFPSGTSWSNPVTIASYPGETAIVYGVSIRDQVISYVVFDRLVIDRGGYVGGPNLGEALQFAHQSHLRFSNGEIRNANYHLISAGQGADLQIINNRIHDTFVGYDAGFGQTLGFYCFYFNAHDSLIEGNTIYNCAGIGLNLYLSGSSAVSNNIVRNNIVSHTSYDDGQRGNEGASLLVDSGSNNLIYNNVFYGSTSPLHVAAIQDFSSAVNNRYYNNTIYNVAKLGVYLYPGSTGALVANNVIYAQGEVPILNSGTGTVLTTNFTGIDPLFVNPGAADFHLGATSLAIGYGTNLSGTFTTDITGATRASSGAWDAGAYAFGALPLQLAFTGQPANRAVGATQPDIVVEIRDEFGAVSASTTLNVTLSEGTLGLPISGTATRAAVAGVATFPGLSFSSIGTALRLTAAAPGVTSGLSAAFNSTEAATQVGFGTQPVPTVEDAVMPAFTVRLEGDAGGVITSATDTVTLSLAGILVPQANLTVTSVDSEDTGYEKAKAIDGNTGLFWHTQWVAAQPAHPHQIILNLGASYSVVGLTYHPRADANWNGNILAYEVYVSTDGATWGTAVKTGSLTPQVKTHGMTWTPKTGQYLRLVAQSEVNGGPYTNANELNVVVASAVALGGDLTQAGVAGVATFNDITVPTPGAGYVFRATSGSLREDLAAPVTITAAPVTATKLAFGVQPANRVQNAVLPTVTVQVQDASSTVVTSATNTITLAEDSVGATITGDVSNAATAGVASFPGLSLPAVGTARQLRATASGLTDATSALFDITAVSGAPLLTSNSLVYRGAFRLSRSALPRAEAGGSAIYWSYAQGPIAYHQTRKTLYMMQAQGHILELNIPPLRAPATVAELAIATHAQPAIDVTQGQWANLGAGGAVIPNGAIFGGIAFHGSAMILSATPYYASGSAQVVSHSTASPTWALSGRQWSGWKAVGTSGKGGFVGGWMVPIPSEWQSAFGGRPYLTGQGAIPIIDRTSFGPALSTFDPAALGVTSPVPVTPILEYPSTHPTLGGYSNTASLPFNRTASVGGVAFPPNTSTVLFLGAIGVGQTGTGDTCYGERTLVQAEHNTIIAGERVCYDLANGDKGPHGYPYITHAMAYDANDLVKVQIGQMQPWEPVPYATWEVTLPFARPERKLCGVSYDEAGKQLFVCQLAGDSTSPPQPLIHVFTVTIP